MTKTLTYFRYLLIVISLLLLLCGGFTLLAPYYWLADIFTNFTPQYALLGGVVAFVLFLQGARNMALVMLVFAAINVYQMHMLWKAQEMPESRTLYDKVTLLQFNVGKGKGQMDAIADWVTRRSHKTDIVILFNVTPAWKATLQKLTVLYPYHYTHSMQEVKDVAVFSKLPVKEFRTRPLRNLDAPIILVDLETTNHTIPWLLGVVHPPFPDSKQSWHERNNVLMNAAKRMALQKQSPMTGRKYQDKVLAGDFYLTPWSPYFQPLLKASGLRDAQDGKGLMGTWPAWAGDKFGTPVDHTLVSSTVKVLVREVEPALGSSHLPVVTTLGIPVVLERE